MFFYRKREWGQGQGLMERSWLSHDMGVKKTEKEGEDLGWRSQNHHSPFITSAPALASDIFETSKTCGASWAYEHHGGVCCVWAMRPVCTSDVQGAWSTILRHEH